MSESELKTEVSVPAVCVGGVKSDRVETNHAETTSCIPCQVSSSSLYYTLSAQRNVSNSVWQGNNVRMDRRSMRLLYEPDFGKETKGSLSKPRQSQCCWFPSGFRGQVVCCENLPQLFKDDGPELLHRTYSVKPHRVVELLRVTNVCVSFGEQNHSLPITYGQSLEKKLSGK